MIRPDALDKWLHDQVGKALGKTPVEIEAHWAKLCDSWVWVRELNQ